MPDARPALILASSSPRRANLLGLLDVAFTVVPADVDETRDADEAPDAYVERLALAKAAAVATSHPDATVIGADTTVAVDGHVLGKPVDDVDAERMLRLLSGRAHTVLTGVAVRANDRSASAVETTEVTFVTLSDADIRWYVGTGEPFGKAGGYGVQGAGGIFVASLRGNLHNVVGLPLITMRTLLRDVGVELQPGA